jgi:hypothetical protein
MSPDPRSSNVSALRSAEGRSNSPRLRRIGIGVLLAIGGIAGLYVALANHSRGRGWAAVVAVISLLGAAISWLAATTQGLSSSGRDPRDFHLRP